jgi:hypothetical protein
MIAFLVATPYLFLCVQTLQRFKELTDLGLKVQQHNNDANQPNHPLPSFVCADSSASRS